MKETSTMLRGRAGEGTYFRKGGKERLPAVTLSWGMRDEKKPAMEKKMEEDISSQRSRSKKNSTLFKELWENPCGYKLVLLLQLPSPSQFIPQLTSTLESELPGVSKLFLFFYFSLRKAD